MELVDERVLEERPVDLPGAELQDVAVELILEGLDGGGDIAFEERRVVPGRGAAAAGSDELGQRVDPIGVRVPPRFGQEAEKPS